MSALYQSLAALALVVALVLGVIWFGNHQYNKGYEAGKADILAAQATAQVKHSKEVKQNYDEIDHNLPNAGDTDAVDQFLLNHTRGNSN